MSREPLIPVAEPILGAREREHVLECLDSGWISSIGPYVGRFEEAVAGMAGVAGAVAVTSGTAALHLALLALGIGPGDEVLVPSLAYVAVANAVTYCGATPVFVDSEPIWGNLAPDALEPHVTPHTRAIIAVHLYGHPCDMDAVRRVAGRHDLAVVEDAAEAHGARYRDRPAGSLGDVAVFSFYGNKIVTTGEGGAVVSNDHALLERTRILRGQGQDLERRYWFPVLGFNYRMTNVAAAIGVGQLERLEWHLARRREIASWYGEELHELSGVRVQREPTHARSAFWMNCVLLEDCARERRCAVMARLADDGIDTRPFFPPLHTLPIYQGRGDDFPVAERLAASGLCLPSGASLTRDQIARIAGSLKAAVAAVGV